MSYVQCVLSVQCVWSVQCVLSVQIVGVCDSIVNSDVPARLQAPGQPKPGLIEPGQAKAQVTA
jgi:hypothetical protein